MTIRPDMRFAVSRRLRGAFAPSRVYYDLDGRQIQVPRSLAEWPSTEPPAWHEATVFSALAADPPPGYSGLWAARVRKLAPSS